MERKYCGRWAVSQGLTGIDLVIWTSGRGRSHLRFPVTAFAQFAKPMTTTLADLRKLSRSLPAFAAFQGHFLSTLRPLILYQEKVSHYLRATYTSESCLAFTVAIPPPGNEPEAFSSLAFFRPAVIAALCEAKPLPVSATTLFESRIS